MRDELGRKKGAGIVSGILIAAAAVGVSEFPALEKTVRRWGDPSYKQIYTELHVERYQGELPESEGREYWTVKAMVHNKGGWPREIQSLYNDLTVYDEEGGYLAPLGIPGQGEEYMADTVFSSAAREFLPPGMEYEISFQVSVPAGNKEIRCSYVDADYEEQEAELRLSP